MNKSIKLTKSEETAKYYHLGMDLVSSVRYKEAYESYNKSLALEPDNLQLSRANMIMAFELGRLEEAIAIYDNVMEIHKNYADEFHKEWTKSIIREIQLIREYEAINYNNNGCDLSRVGKYEEALEEHNKAIILDPCNVYFLKEKIDVLLKLGRGDEAIEVFDEVIAIEPDYADSYNNKGNSLYELGRYEEAIESYDKAISLKPDIAACYYNKGNSLSYLGRLEDAIREYDKAISLKPDIAAYYNNKGNSLDELGRYEEAIENYDKAIELNTDDAKAINNKSIVIQKLGSEGDAKYK